MRRRIALAAVLATLAGAPAASAQGATIQAIDPSSWSPPNVSIRAGETVTWNTHTGPSVRHNVKSDSPNWTIDSPASTSDPTPVSYTFTAPGTYRFICFYHGQAMSGSVQVADASGTPPPPPPPPPPSEQWWQNDQQPPAVVEVTDEVRPRLSRVRVARVRNGARVRFRLSERAQVIVRFKLGGVTVKTARKTFGKGPGTLTVRDRRMHGRYRVEALARDLSGNRSRVKRTRLTIR